MDAPFFAAISSISRSRPSKPSRISFSKSTLVPATRQPQFDAPALPLHCVLSGSTLSDVKHKLLKSLKIRDAGACVLYMTSLFPYLVQLFLVSPAPEALLEKMDEPDNFAAGLPRLLALANMSQEHLTRSFRRCIGLTPTQYVNAKRMGMAARTSRSPIACPCSPRSTPCFRGISC